MGLIPVLKTESLVLLSLGLVARQAAAVDNCADLISEVSAISSTGTVSIENDFTCSAQIEISASQTVTITGPSTISIGAGFLSDTFSLFVNNGVLTLEDILVESDSTEGIRAVWNTGSLSVDGCSFDGLNGSGGFSTFLEQGGAIYSLSSGSINVTDSAFTSNIVTYRGGAIFAGDAETLTIMGSVFSSNEADSDGGAEAAAGGDIWANEDVELTVTGSSFFGSLTEYGGASIESCGGTFSDSSFTSTGSSLTTEHFGAVLVGRPGIGCPRELTMAACTFDNCTVDPSAGRGGALAIFDTSATIESCVFENSVGTALLFESSSATGEHKLEMSSNQFNLNTGPSELYFTDSDQGSAVVISNTGVEEGDEPVPMGEFYDTFCYANEPYECEFIEDLAEIAFVGDFKCSLCDIGGTQQSFNIDDDDFLVGSTGHDANDSSSGSWDTQDYVIAGLSAALALLVVVGSAIFVVLRCRRNKARSGETPGAGQPPATTAPPDTSADPPAAEICPPATATNLEEAAPPAPTAPTTIAATTGTVQPTNRP